MPSYSYNPTIPASNNNPADDQPLMQTNFGSINGIISTDHYTFGSSGSNDGFHTQCTFPNVTTQSTPSNPKSVLYTNNDAFSNPQLFFLNSVNSGFYSIPSGSQANGMVPLFGGVLLQWGSSSLSSNGASFTFPIAFPHNCFTFVVTTGNKGNQPYSFVANSVSASGVGSIFFSPNAAPVNFFWIAIGN